MPITTFENVLHSILTQSSPLGVDQVTLRPEQMSYFWRKALNDCFSAESKVHD